MSDLVPYNPPSKKPYHVVGSPNSSNGLPVTMYQLGGREYPLYSNPRCKTCMSEWRNEIEVAILKSYGYKRIARSLPESAGVNHRNIMDHYLNGHMPIDESVRRVVMEEHAKERGLDIEGYESTLANHITFARLGLQKGLQRLMSGELEPDLDQTIALANFLFKVDQVAGGDIDKEMLDEAFEVYYRAIEAHVSPEKVQAIGETIEADPILKALREKALNRRAALALEAGDDDL